LPAAGPVAPSDPKHWTTGTLLAHPSSCALWASAGNEAHALRCTIDDRAPAAETAAFYADTAAAIDRCLAGRPDAARWVKATVPVAIPNGLTGRKTTWVLDDAALRFTIALADFKRHHDASSYDDLSVDYLKY
jgi:hypothetical protein